MLQSLEDHLRAEIAAHGPIPFERFVEIALYDVDQGFYATSGRAGGRRGDFVTSVEVGPLFAAVIAGWLDDRWREAGSPEVFHVSEAGAGAGTLFRGIHRADPPCLASLRYTLVERSAAMRVAHQSLPTDAWRSSIELPEHHQHVILANELLDNLAFGIAERTSAGWAPVGVADIGGRFVLVPGEADDRLAHLEHLVPDAPIGSRVPVPTRAIEWVDAAAARADRVLVFDYGAPTAELVERGQQGWLRTYARHQRGSDPFVAVGQVDITHDVPVDQLPAPIAMCSQADWLRTAGIEDLVEAARATWRERAHIGDLAAMVARSAIGEAAALTDAAGLGGFVAIEWGAAAEADI